MQVIVDLHGGDSDNPVALAEFEEIKEKVNEEVSENGSFFLASKVLIFISLLPNSPSDSAPPAKDGAMA